MTDFTRAEVLLPSVEIDAIIRNAPADVSASRMLQRECCLPRGEDDRMAPNVQCGTARCRPDECSRRPNPSERPKFRRKLRFIIVAQQGRLEINDGLEPAAANSISFSA
ncbi:MAG: hypothetical protein ACOY7L_10755 [Pseudomonadota bacterium]|nr:MAG: hypothetical protein ABT11_18140 [Novosphingobium sp. SCN 66-18]